MRNLLFLAFYSTLVWSQHSVNSNSFFDGEQELTGEEQKEADNYIHEGQAESLYQEICADFRDGNLTNKIEAEGKLSVRRINPQRFKDICENGESAFGGQFAKTLEAMLPAATQAYSLFNAMGSPSIEMNQYNDSNQRLFSDADGKTIAKTDSGLVKEDGSAFTGDPKDLEKKTEDKPDICSYIPAVTETGANALQLAKQSRIQENVENSLPQARQAATFYALADGHKAKSETTLIQATGWGGTAACYAAYLAGGAVGNAKFWLKMGAATLLGTFYGIKSEYHKRRQLLLEVLASRLPQAGDCNPHTNTSCFCLEPTSPASDPSNYQKYCIPKQLSRDDGNLNPTVCVDAKGEADPECKCKKRGNCIDAKLTSQALKLGLNPAMMKDPLAALRPLAKGFGSENLSPYHRRNMAMAKKSLKKYQPSGKAPSLNSTSKEVAKALNAHGIPALLAAKMASTAAPIKSLGSAQMAAFDSGAKPAFKKKPHKAKFSNGGSVGSSKNSSGNSKFSFGNKYKSKKRGVSSVEIINFAEQSQKEAEITKDKSKGLFEILSRRYQLQGLK